MSNSCVFADEMLIRMAALKEARKKARMVANLAIDIAPSSSPSSAVAPAAADDTLYSAAAAAAAATASNDPGHAPALATVEYVMVPSQSPPRPKLHVFFQAFPQMGMASHEASFRAAAVLPSPPRERSVVLTSTLPHTSPAALQLRRPVSTRCKLLRPPPAPTRPEQATVGVQTDPGLGLTPEQATVGVQTDLGVRLTNPLTNTGTQTEPLLSQALDLHDVIVPIQRCIKDELQRWLGFLVHLH
jgi:hypothetical protein